MALFLFAAGGAAEASAQVADSLPAPPAAPTVASVEPVPSEIRFGTLTTIGSASEDRLRVLQILGGAAPAGYLLRSPSTLTEKLAAPHLPVVELLLPEVRRVSNSDIPYSINDGALWAGRGSNLQISGGVRSRFGPVSLVLAPQIVYSENRDFEILPPHLYRRFFDRSPYHSIWFVNEATVDMPYRFGSRPASTALLGQSSLSVDLGPATIGAGTENQWWGPGIRNAILLSNNAAGVPHLQLRTSRPLETGIGAFEGRWFVGWLDESPFFDDDPDNDLRSLSAAALTYTPRWEPNLTVGVARAVYAPANDRRQVAQRAFQVFTSWERRDSLMQVEWDPDADQIISLFGRWILPSEGFEVYGEWARHELPVSLRDLVLAPHHTRGYTLGLQWARSVAPGVVRLQGELTQLEQSPTFRQRPIDSFYTGRSAPHGFTHGGQILGAAIGPGSSSQWAAVDLLHERGSVGVFGGRVRWESDGLYSSPSPRPERGFRRTAHAHDVSVLFGIRAGLALWGMELRGEYTAATRYNFLFQNPDIFFGPEGAVDIRNRTVRIELTPTRSLRLVRNRETQ